jgi:AcrR family transcriptional regulator
MIVKTLLEVNDQDTELNRKANHMLDAAEHHFAEALTKARQRSELQPETDCNRLARLLQAQVLGLRVFAQREVPAAHVEQLADDMVAILDQYAGVPSQRQAL